MNAQGWRREFKITRPGRTKQHDIGNFERAKCGHTEVWTNKKSEQSDFLEHKKFEIKQKMQKLFSSRLIQHSY